MFNRSLLFAALLFFLLAAIGVGQSPRADYDIIIRTA